MCEDASTCAKSGRGRRGSCNSVIVGIYRASVRTVVFGVLVLAAVLGGVLGWWVPAGVAVALLALAAYDVLQRRHAVLRNYPVVGHLRYLLEAIRPEIQQYFIERDFDGRPYDRDTRTVDLRARQGHTG